MADADLPPLGRLLAAALPGVRTARREAAAAGHLGQRRHLAGNRLQPAAAAREIGQGGKEFLRIRVAGRREKDLTRRFLDDLAGVHDADPRRHLRDDAEVVGDQQHAHRVLGLQPAQQFEHLRLDGHVERRRRLIGDQQARPAGERDGDHHPLLHAAGELEGILAEPSFGIRDADRGQQLERAFAGRRTGRSSGVRAPRRAGGRR
jgi:hypothetical protein